MSDGDRLAAVRRVNFYAGQLLTPEDLQAEQDYHRDMRYLQNRLLGSGVVSGLDVSVEDGATLRVTAGFAIDRYGREIVLADDVCLDVSAALAGPDASGQVRATWEQVPDAPVATADKYAFARWLERPLLSVEPPDRAVGDALVLGRVLRSDGVVTAVDLDCREVLRRCAHEEMGS